MKRMNDSQRWLLVAEHFRSAYFNEKGICLLLDQMARDDIIPHTAATRMEAQLWTAAYKGRVRGVNPRTLSNSCGYMWPPRARAQRVAAARKMSRLVKR